MSSLAYKPKTQRIADQLSGPLTILFRKSLKEGKIPLSWKEATVTPVFKKGTRTIKWKTTSPLVSLLCAASY